MYTNLYYLSIFFWFLKDKKEEGEIPDEEILFYPDA